MLGFARSTLARSTLGRSTMAKCWIAQTQTETARRMQSGMAEEVDVDEKRARFMGVFQEIRSELMETLGSSYEVPESLQEYLDYMVMYTTPGGKLNRGLTVVDTAEALTGGLDDEGYFKAATLGWCVEFMQAFMLVADDIMDHSLTRRGVPCWYQAPHIGMDAVNDALLLESFLYKILRNNFGNQPELYITLLDMFRETSFKTELGQLTDVKTAPAGDVDLSRFTMEKYLQIVKYKTAFYSFSLPVSLGMTLAGVEDPKAFADSEKILIDMGTLFQVQDDYIDCFGVPAVSGKIGTDIQDNKCTWLVVKALQLADQDQRYLLQNNYGRADAFYVEAVKDVYRSLDIPAHYAQYESHAINSLEGEIAGFDHFDGQVFGSLLSKINNRAA